MTVTAVITFNAALGAAVTYGLFHLLAYGLKSHREELHEVDALPKGETRRIAA